MPRRSAGSVVPLPLDPVPVPAPPGELTDAQGAVWRRILLSKPSDWWDESNFPLLTALVKHISAHAVLCERLERLTLDDLEQLPIIDKLSAMRDRESRAMAMLSTKMRLTQQAKCEPERARTIAMRGGRAARPWLDPAENIFARNGRRR